MNYGNANSMYPYQTNSIYNPYNDYYNNIQNQTVTIMPPNNQGPLPPNLQPTVIPPPVILANTYLPKTYYEDIIDNLELVSLNMINDLKALKKNQKQLKVNRFDPNFLINLKSSIKEQLTEVEEFREKEKFKLTEEFKSAKSDIESFLRDKFKPSQEIMENFKNELKQEKKALAERLRDIEETVKKENDEVETMLINSKDPVMKYAAQRIYRPNEQSELDFAIMLKKKYAPKEKQQIIEKQIELKYPVEIDYKPITEEQKKKEKEASIDNKEEEDFDDIVKLTERDDIIEPKRNINLKQLFRKIANVVIASRKMIILRQLKIYSRIKDLAEILLTVEEYLDSMIQNILSNPIGNIERIKSKLDASSKLQMNKINEILKSIINCLIDKTTKVQINRTFSFFFRRYIFNLDVVPPECFSLFEKRRIKYIKSGDLDKNQQQFVLIMKVILNSFVYEILLYKSEENEDPIIAHNLKLIATIFYYSIIGYYREEIPFQEGVFDNSKAIFDEDGNEDENKLKNDKSIDIHFKEQLISLDLLRKEEKKEVMEIQQQNVKYLDTYYPDTMDNDIEVISKLIFPYDYIRPYIENETSLYLITPLLVWSEKVIEIMNSHAFGFRD